MIAVEFSECYWALNEVFKRTIEENYQEDGFLIGGKITIDGRQYMVLNCHE
jgi:hypothetical protein